MIDYMESLRNASNGYQTDELGQMVFDEILPILEAMGEHLQQLQQKLDAQDEQRESQEDDVDFGAESSLLLPPPTISRLRDCILYLTWEILRRDEIDDEAKQNATDAASAAWSIVEQCPIEHAPRRIAQEIESRVVATQPQQQNQQSEDAPHAATEEKTQQ
jgi:hypothetical protein